MESLGEVMDIFTTQLTRVVQVPIKPTSLKVKALLKEAANSKLTQDPDHLENHEYYFTSEKDQYHGSKQEPEQDTHNEKIPSLDNGKEEKDKKASQSLSEEFLTKKKHLDLYA